MITTYTYRQATAADLPELKALGILSYSQFSTVLSNDNWNKLYSNLNDDHFWISLLSNATTFVCIDSQIIGMAYLMPSGHPSTLFEASWASLRMVGVDPSYRGNGICKTLVKLCINQAKQQGETLLALHTSEFMDDARHIYESLGFQKVKELNPIYDKRYWLYQLDLTTYAL